MSYRPTRVLASLCALSILTSGATARAPQDASRLRPVAPPEHALRRTPAVDGSVSVLLDLGPTASAEPVSVTVGSFWGTDGNEYAVALAAPDADAGGGRATVHVDQPLTLRAKGIPKDVVVWGALEAKQGDAAYRLPLVLGAFGPTVEDEAPLRVPASGRGRVRVDLAQHRTFGSVASFSLTPFAPRSPGGQTVALRFVGPEGGDAGVDHVELAIPKSEGALTLELDALALLPDTDYAGALRTTIGEREFFETPIVLRRDGWSGTGGFAPVAEQKGAAEVDLAIRAASPDQSLRNLFVASVTTASDEVARALEFRLGDVELTREPATDPEEIQSRSIEPNGLRRMTVSAPELPVGSHEITFELGATNVAPADWAKVKIELVGRNPAAYAVVALVAGVLLSWVMTKGIATAVRRRDLKRRIARIRKASWLAEDRLGALPIVRAFARIAVADRAMQQKVSFWNPLEKLTRLSTVPQLIEDEVTEVEGRLDVLKRLNELAIYWKAAPSARNATTSDANTTVVNRAQKILRRIVERVGALQDGEEISPQIRSELEALEGWYQRELLEAGYWASLRGDIQALLGSVQTAQFDFDEVERSSLVAALRDLHARTRAAARKAAIAEAIDAAEAARTAGTSAIHLALDKLPSTAVPDEIRTSLYRLEDCERETVRRLMSIVEAATPKSLNAMIAVEDTYTYLKLIWEQRKNRDYRNWLILAFNNDLPVERIADELDMKVWRILKGDPENGVERAVRIVLPKDPAGVESLSPLEFRVECTRPDAKTFLFKHGLEYEWSFCWDRRPGERPPGLTAVTRSTFVTQFMPVATTIHVGVTVRYGSRKFQIDGASFDALPSTRFEHLSPTNVPEVLGIAIALLLALVTGLQSDAFAAALVGSWKEYLALGMWGVGADQLKNLIQMTDRVGKGSPT